MLNRVHSGIRTTLALLLAAGLIGWTAGCGRKKLSPEEQARAAAAEEQKIKDRWMTVGTYVTGDEKLQQQIMRDLENLDKETSYRLILFNQEPGKGVEELDGEFHSPDCHFRLRRNLSGPFWEFFILGDRYFAQSDRRLVDFGPQSRGEGEKHYRPLWSEMRVAMLQALRGGIKDLGRGKYRDTPVRKYDLRGVFPGPEHIVLTAVVDIDETRDLLIHMVVGAGTGSNSTDERYHYYYREMAIANLGQVGPIRIPESVEVIPAKELKNQDLILH